ncbi:MAG: helix-turn-helix domain-containing protein [Candidatus Methylomirabilales bacterium]
MCQSPSCPGELPAPDGSALATQISGVRKKVGASGRGARGAEDRRLRRVREEAEREHIASILHRTKGNRAQAARILGISRKTLWKKLKHLGISSPPNVTQR